MPSTTKTAGKDGIEMPVTTHRSVADSYMELIREFPLRRLRTAAEHRRATKLVVRLSSEGSDRGVAEYVDVLVDLIADYERRAGQIVDTSKVTAADLVRHRIEEKGLSVNALARLVGVPQSNLSEMLSGKRGWSKSAIRGLSTHLNIPADRFFV
jgi:antitoxin component HigA of HigAB toxin-antitoxin module